MDPQGPLGELRELLWEFGWEDKKKGLPTGCVSRADGHKLAGERGVDHFSDSAGFSKGFSIPLESCLKQSLVRGGMGTESSQDCAPNPMYPVPSPVIQSVHWGTEFQASV